MEPVNPSEAAFDEQLAKMLAQSREAFARYQRTLSEIETQMIGTFYGYPAKLREWIFFRVGLKSSATAQGLAHLLRQQGWVDAPRGTKMVGTEVWDGEDGGLILCAPQEIYRRQKAVEQEAQSKRRMKEEAQKFDGLAAQFKNIPGVAIEDFDVQAGESSLGDLEAKVSEQKIKRAESRSR